MRLGIMQPYFAPALGYLDLIHLCDEWVVFDTAQYRRHSWMNRNRVLHPKQGWQYITARVNKPSRGTPIHAVSLAKGDDWQGLLLRQLEHYRKHAPHYDTVTALVERSLAAETSSLARLCAAFLANTCALLDIAFTFRFFSEMDLELGPIEGPGDWALRISQAMGAAQYVNPPGGEGIFDRAEFSRAGIDLEIRHFRDMVYQPQSYAYIPTLSIVDLLMWNEPTKVKAYLDQQREAFLETKR